MQPSLLRRAPVPCIAVRYKFNEELNYQIDHRLKKYPYGSQEHLLCLQIRAMRAGDKADLVKECTEIGQVSAVLNRLLKTGS